MRHGLPLTASALAVDVAQRAMSAAKDRMAATRAAWDHRRCFAYELDDAAKEEARTVDNWQRAVLAEWSERTGKAVAAFEAEDMDDLRI